ncbi:RDD family protein, partial [Mycobacterium tuberculosis]|nr:RDD family protein [Mycobacterium tuberculosis]
NDLVSGEAVALDLPPASLGRRIVSGILDLTIVLIVLVALMWLSLKVAASLSDGAVLAGACALSWVLALIVVPTAVETLSRGKSLGHRA